MEASDERSAIRTKIVATLGPATDDPERLAAVLEAGVSVCRLNFSHGTHEDHARTLQNVRRWAQAHDRPIAVLGDLCGPKIRLNDVAGGAIDVHRGDTVQFVRGDAECTPGRFTTNYPRFVDEVDVGHRVFIDDGLVRFLVTDREPDAVVCTCTAGGRVLSHKGVNLPNTPLSTPALTEKDRVDLDWAIEHGLDYVALSFVREPRDVDELRACIQQRGGRPGVVLKIEKPQALEHLDTFIDQADAIMIARGDLGVEMDVWRVPLIQKEITARCRRAGKPVIVATQMLQSMVTNPIPTRAEVSDVANAILDLNDAVMLSAETAAGSYPDLAVTMMGHVAEATERYLRENEHYTRQPFSTTDDPAQAITYSAVQAARRLDARLVAAWTATGRTVRLLASRRLPMPVVGLTFDPHVYRQLSLLYGVIPLRTEPMSHPGKMARVLDQKLVEKRLAAPGDVIVVVTSTQPNQPGATDTTHVHRVGSNLAAETP